MSDWIVRQIGSECFADHFSPHSREFTGDSNGWKFNRDEERGHGITLAGARIGKHFWV